MGNAPRGKGLVPDYVPDYILASHEDAARRTVLRSLGLQSPPTAPDRSFEAVQTIVAILCIAIGGFVGVFGLLHLATISPMMALVAIGAMVVTAILWSTGRAMAGNRRH